MVMSRRKFLKGTAALPAIATLPALAPPEPEPVSELARSRPEPGWDWKQDFGSSTVRFSTLTVSTQAVNVTISNELADEFGLSRR